MQRKKFQPGFRLSATDVVVLIVGALASAYVFTIDKWSGAAIAYVVLHFFLFCNVLRMSRSLELIWAAVFAALAIATISLNAITWPIVLTVSAVMTLVVAMIETRQPSYHGVGWRKINPRLPEWFERHHAASS